MCQHRSSEKTVTFVREQNRDVIIVKELRFKKKKISPIAHTCDFCASQVAAFAVAGPLSEVTLTLCIDVLVSQIRNKDSTNFGEISGLMCSKIL